MNANTQRRPGDISAEGVRNALQTAYRLTSEWPDWSLTARRFSFLQAAMLLLISHREPVTLSVSELVRRVKCAPPSQIPSPFPMERDAKAYAYPPWPDCHRILRDLDPFDPYVVGFGVTKSERRGQVYWSYRPTADDLVPEEKWTDVPLWWE